MTVSFPSSSREHFHPPEWWERMKLAFEAAADAEPDDREAILDRLLADDLELRREVESLLDADRQATDFLSRDASASLGPDALGAIDDPAGQTFGDYIAERKLGHGGMGVVYLAHHRDQERRAKVAVKVVRRGFENAHVLERFRKEREILGRLVHPNIARVLDGGTTADGRPYFVMEYVDGVPVDEFCRRERADLPQRLRLFLRICSAVTYAHQNLVVHRDLKPHNVLVTADGLPKLLDFGIAKLLDDSADAHTVTELRMLTPDYASPEQILGFPITTASDVYSLGVLLYELLTAARPYRVTGKSPHELARAITEAVPPRPSTAAAPEGIAPRRLRGDLDNIILMALRKEPSRRYPSVQALADDIDRHLDGRPVKARTDSFLYRASKFVRRNAWGVAAAIAIVLSLSSAVVISTRMARRAERERVRAEQQTAVARATFDDLRRLTHTLLFDLHDQIAPIPGAMRARQTLAQTALSYLDIMARATKGDPSLQSELARAYDTVGSITFTVRDAILHHQRAAEIARTIVRDHPREVEPRMHLATALAHLGDELKVGAEYEAAESVCRETIAIAEDLWKTTAHTSALRWLLIEVYGTQLELLDRHGNSPEADHAAARVVEIGSRVFARTPSDLDAQRLYSSAERLAGRHANASRRFESGLAHFTRATAVAERLERQNPSDARIRRALWSTYFGLGNSLMGLGRTADAELYYGRARVLIESLSAIDPVDTGHRRTLAITLRALGDAAVARGDYEAAAAFYAQSSGLSEEILKADSSNAESREDLQETLTHERALVEGRGARVPPASFGRPSAALSTATGLHR